VDLKRKLKKALLQMLAANEASSDAKTESSRRSAEHQRQVAKVRYQKAETKLKRAKRMKQYRDAGLL